MVAIPTLRFPERQMKGFLRPLDGNAHANTARACGPAHRPRDLPARPRRAQSGTSSRRTIGQRITKLRLLGGLLRGECGCYYAIRHRFGRDSGLNHSHNSRRYRWRRRRPSFLGDAVGGCETDCLGLDRNHPSFAPDGLASLTESFSFSSRKPEGLGGSLPILVCGRASHP